MRVPVDLRTWAMRHGISEAALLDLAETLGAGTQPEGRDGGSEARVQSQVRLAAPRHNMRLFRNNTGVLRNEAGTPVRFGLANDSKALNARLKSSDLIGWRRVVITQEMVGATVAIFVALECKHAGWKFKGDEHEIAQLTWLKLVFSEGGIASFTTGDIPDAKDVFALPGA